MGSAATRQDVLPRYAAGQLNCSRFLERSVSEIRTESGRQSRLVTVDRAGILTLLARGSAPPVEIEAWYDSLAVAQRSGDSTAVPDTDGLLGGRFRGTLEPGGRYHPSARPFVPDEVAEVTDPAAVLDDFFPRLSPHRLRPGQQWRDSAGLTLTRLQDSAGTGIECYSLQSRRESREAVPQGDTVPVALRQVSVEQGDFLWDPVRGLLRRRREIVIETSVPAGGRVRQAVRSRIVQRITADRLAQPDSSICR